MDSRIPTPALTTSMTASVALRTFGNWTTATFVGNSGASRIVTGDCIRQTVSPPMPA